MLLALVLAALAAGTAGGKASLQLEARDSYFTLAGQQERNPLLLLPPGPVVLTLAQRGAAPHNWALEGVPGAVSEYVTGQDPTATVAFTLPEAGEFRYLCEAHQPVMAGTLRVDAAAVGDPAEAPAAGAAAVAALALLALARRRA